jgi:hypothetical protein
MTHHFKTTNIKGKQYVEVNERIKYFRTAKEYAGWTLTSELISLEPESCVVRAEIRNAENALVATGFAQEDRASSHINKTSYVENCETSAWGRALANLGIGIDTSIASSDEVAMAIAKQNSTPAATTTAPAPAQQSDVYQQAIEYLKGAKDKAQAYEAVVTKYGSQFTENQKKGLQKFVK